MFFVASNVLTHYKRTLLVAYIIQLTYLICVATYKYYTAYNMLKMLQVKLHNIICHGCLYAPPISHCRSC